MKKGIVKWFRHDGTGYINPETDSKTSIYFDSSSIVAGFCPDKGSLVEFETKQILGREVAVKVRLRGTK